MEKCWILFRVRWERSSRVSCGVCVLVQAQSGFSSPLTTHFFGFLWVTWLYYTFHCSTLYHNQSCLASRVMTCINSRSFWWGSAVTGLPRVVDYSLRSFFLRYDTLNGNWFRWVGTCGHRDRYTRFNRQRAIDSSFPRRIFSRVFGRAVALYVLVVFGTYIVGSYLGHGTDWCAEFFYDGLGSVS